MKGKAHVTQVNMPNQLRPASVAIKNLKLSRGKGLQWLLCKSKCLCKQKHFSDPYQQILTFPLHNWNYQTQNTLCFMRTATSQTPMVIINGLVFPYFSLLCTDVNCDFVLILILYCVPLILILYCTTTYYYVLFHWRCMYVWYVLLNSTYLHLLPLLNYLDIKLPAGIKTDRKN